MLPERLSLYLRFVFQPGNKLGGGILKVISINTDLARFLDGVGVKVDPPPPFRSLVDAVIHLKADLDVKGSPERIWG